MVAPGFNTVSFKERDAGLVADPDDDPDLVQTVKAASGSLSTIGLKLKWEMAFNQKRSVSLQGGIPLTGTGGSNYAFFGACYQFYLGGSSSKFVHGEGGAQVSYIPKFRYYVGPFLGLGYIVYVAQDKQKSDTLADIGAMGGMSLKLTQSWDLKADIAATRGIGNNGDTFAIRAYVGIGFYL